MRTQRLATTRAFVIVVFGLVVVLAIPLAASDGVSQSGTKASGTKAMNVLRTPDDRFKDLPGFPYKPHYVDVDGLQMHYIDEGSGDPILCIQCASPLRGCWPAIFPTQHHWRFLYGEMT